MGSQLSRSILIPHGNQPPGHPVQGHAHRHQQGKLNHARQHGLDQLPCAFPQDEADADDHKKLPVFVAATGGNGRIPGLIDHDNDDFTVFESAAILMYLASGTTFAKTQRGSKGLTGRSVTAWRPSACLVCLMADWRTTSLLWVMRSPSRTSACTPG